MIYDFGAEENCRLVELGVNKLFFLFYCGISLFIYCVHMCESHSSCVEAMGQLSGVCFLLLPSRSRDGPQVITPGGKHLYPLRQLAGPIKIFFEGLITYLLLLKTHTHTIHFFKT